MGFGAVETGTGAEAVFPEDLAAGANGLEGLLRVATSLFLRDDDLEAFSGLSGFFLREKSENMMR